MTTTTTEIGRAVQAHAIPGTDGQPGWIVDELPPQYGELAAQIAKLKSDARLYEEVASVLWQTGRPLTQAVRDLFAALGFEAELAPAEASYDIRVQLDGGRRLLVEAFGGREALDRKSPQIAQILRALQEDAGPQDRVVVVGNVFCDQPPGARRQEPISPDALRIVQGLGANFVAAPTLFGLWRYSLTDMAGARKSVLKLHEQDGGIFR